jgi:hypothetical protein
MIFEKEECFFAGIPKNGTHTVFAIVKNIEDKMQITKRANYGRMSDEETTRDYADKPYSFFRHGHMTIKQWINIKKRTKKYKNYTTFSIIRNPYERAVSIFRHYCIINNRTDVNIKHFDNWLKSRASKTIYDWGTQSEFLVNELGEINVDCLAKLESLNIGWEEYRQINSKWPAFKPGFALNSKHGINIKQFYNTYTEELVYKIYKEDFKLLGYGRL